MPKSQRRVVVPLSPSEEIELASTHVAASELLREVKIRARIRLHDLSNQVPDAIFYARWISRKRRWALPASWKLAQALNIVSTELGFQDWEHLRRVLEGRAQLSDDLGGLWYDLRCQFLLNSWFATYADASSFCRQGGERFLFPFAKQIVVGDANFVRMLGLDPASPLWKETRNDLFASYGSPAWRALCSARLVATRGRLPIGRTPTARNL
ncbi:hypothetical protein [Bradyrhizobium macuxiense]|uniref:hypothetical protein n=1 Tax=Bradyrhizobium macuxiense TaxID=1755647 RepID=UPI0011BE9773|nr:hypothetical protein [Bradyrhizobium macuxiense]